LVDPKTQKRCKFRARSLSDPGVVNDRHVLEIAVIRRL
jgi:hypothetical protein